MEANFVTGCQGQIFHNNKIMISTKGFQRLFIITKCQSSLFVFGEILPVAMLVAIEPNFQLVAMEKLAQQKK